MEIINFGISNICDFGLNFRFDGFRVLYVCVATFMWLMSMTYMSQTSAKLTI